MIISQLPTPPSTTQFTWFFSLLLDFCACITPVQIPHYSCHYAFISLSITFIPLHCNKFLMPINAIKKIIFFLLKIFFLIKYILIKVFLSSTPPRSFLPPIPLTFTTFQSLIRKQRSFYCTMIKQKK